jgi:hypothetical protein
LARFTAVFIAALACLIPTAFVVAADTPASTPAGVVTAFYKKRLATNFSGAPTPQQLQALAPFLSQHLQALLERAWQKHQRDLAQAPGEKPAFAEGDLFSSLFEGPASFDIVRSETLVHEYAVTVRFKHDTTSWQDVVRLANKQGRLVIVDIEYGGDWPFAAKGTLVSALDEGMMTHE